MTLYELHEYIKRALGAPKLNIEVDSAQINDRIQDAYDRFVEQHYDGTKKGIITFDLVVGQTEYTLPSNVQTIFEVFPTNGLDFDSEPLLLQYPMVYAGYEFYSGSFSSVDSLIYNQNLALNTESYEQRALFDFNKTTKKLTLFEAPDTAQKFGAIAYISESLTDGVEDDLIFNDRWFKQYCVALVGLQWSYNIGKYASAPMPGGATLNYSEIQQRYEAMKEQLEEQLIQEFTEPIDVFIG